MAGSIGHCVEKSADGAWSYRGNRLLENMGDMAEGVEEMMFVILFIRQRWAGGDTVVDEAIEEYFKCRRGEKPWPKYFKVE